MKIIHKRVRIPQNYLTSIPENGNFYIALSNLPDFLEKLTQIGFTQLEEGEQMLPAITGRISRFNAEGGYIIRKDLPKEIMYRAAEITDWHGYTHHVQIPYQRYPRDPILPPSVELVIMNDANESPILASPILINTPNNYERIKHIINLFLEYFGECDILNENLLPAFNTTVTRLNWNVLPQGNYPWEVLRNNVQDIINNAPVNRRQITERRIQVISANNPDFVAIGRAGFKGYIVFGFTTKNIYILESLYTGNATYVLGQNWEVVSQLTKEEILNQNLQRDRFIHRDGWDDQIRQLLA